MKNDTVLVFKYLDYRQYIRDWTKSQKFSESALTLTSLAREIGMQPPAFSKVMNGDTEFSPDQGYLLCKRLGLNEESTVYFQLLIERERSGLEERRGEILRKLLEFQKRNVSTPQLVDSCDFEFGSKEDEVAYFANPWAPLIHIALTIPRYQANVFALATQLQLSSDAINEILGLLRRMGLVRRVSQAAWEACVKSVHGQDLGNLPLAQQLLTRSISLQRIAAIPLRKRFGLSVAFSSNQKDFERCRQVLVKAATELQTVVAESEPQDLYQLAIDLFPWFE